MDTISLGNEDSECKRKPVIDIQPPYERLEAAARLPGLLLFEEQRHDYKLIKHYSMKTNEYLQCKWKQYIDAGKKVRLAVTIPDVKYVSRNLAIHVQIILQSHNELWRAIYTRRFIARQKLTAGMRKFAEELRSLISGLHRGNGRFINQHLQFIRGSSAKPNYKRQMRCGPGTDMYGPLPVSNDLHIRQTVAVPKRGKPKTAGNRVAKLKFKRH